MNATFVTALDFMDEGSLETVQNILALPVPLAIIAKGGENGPPGFFVLVPQLDVPNEQAQQVMSAYRHLGEPENLTGDDRAEMALAVSERLSDIIDGDPDDEDDDES